MKLSQLVFKSMRKNIKHYYLYFFALIFSVTLYFSFTTLQYNPEVLTATKASGSATAGFGAATYLLYFIVLFFVLYANHLFMKRRSKELGLYQLIGMTKTMIVRIVALENALLFTLAVIIGMGIGFVTSRLFAMILMNMLEQDALVMMTFSIEALQQTALVFTVLLVIIVMQTALIIYRTTLLSLFQANQQAEERVKRFSWVQMIIGAIGLVAITSGYYLSTQLFTTPNMQYLMLMMVAILALTIGGTFLVFRFSVAFLMNVLRLQKKGHLRLVDVVAFTPIMHRMKGNAKSLTLITVLTAVSLAMTTLAYISYYSVDAKAERLSPAAIVAVNEQGETFIDTLKQAGIEVDTKVFDVKYTSVRWQDLIEVSLLNTPLNEGEVAIPIFKLSDVQQLYPSYHVQDDEVFVVNYASMLSEVMPMKEGSYVNLSAGDAGNRFLLKDVLDVPIAVVPVSDGGPAFVVSDAVFQQIEMVDETHSAYSSITTQYLIDVAAEDLAQATALFHETKTNEVRYMTYDYKGELVENLFLQETYEETRASNLVFVGLTIFISAFIGLAFLMATGSILYFKQMVEADEEKSAYTILRKVGFSQQEILRGVYVKQAFNFGIPLLIGLLHSYFAVKSGWFLFGSELIAPLLITMGLYILMYALFTWLSIRYYKSIIHQAL